MPGALRRYLRFIGRDVDAEVDEELRFHLEERTRLFEARGLSPEEARRAALERFGDLARIGSELREHDHRRQRGRERREYMADLLQDLRYGMRSLRRSPGFALVATLTLALGIGATTAIFSVVNAVILRPLPYPAADRLVMVWLDNQRIGMSEDIHSWPNFIDYREQSTAFDRMAGWTPVGANITGGCPEAQCEPLRASGAAATSDLLPMLGVSPIIGRSFTEEETLEGNDAVVVISHGLWTRFFGADPAVLGATLRANGRERTVIGVMPADFAFPASDTDLWIPLVVPAPYQEARSAFWLYAMGRLAPGASLERARTDVGTIAARMQAEYPELRDYGVNLVPLADHIVGRSLRSALWVMLAAVGAVLLIACANVANLMLSRAATREREVGVRLALGAGRTRLVRQLLTESVLLAAIGGALALFIAWGGLRVLIAMAPADIPRLDQVGIDGAVLGLTILVALLTGLGFGLVPALQATRPNLTEALREGSRGTTGQRGNRMRRILAGAQLALVVVLLTGAGLLIRSFQELQRVNLGFQPDNLLTMRIALPGAKYQTAQQRAGFFEDLLERVTGLPDVREAGAISSVFLSQTPNSTSFTIEGRERTPDIANTEVPLDNVTPSYFRTMGIPLVRGRFFTAEDRSDAPPVVIINETMARRYWPDEDAVGRRFRYGGEESDAPWLTIVGVVGDMRRTGYDSPVRYETFLPHAQRSGGAMTLAIRTTGDPLALAGAVRGEVRAIDSEQPVYEIQSMDQLLSSMVAQRRFSMALLGTFAGLALTLGLIGVYGVTSYLVAQRTREVGLRIALGAQQRTLVWLVVRQGMAVAAVGLAVGLLGALAAARVMQGLLYGVSPTDAATLAGVSGILVAATLLANWIPARRAARVDPLVALRAE